MEGENMRPMSDHKIIFKILALLAITAIVIVAMLRDRIVNAPQWQVTVVGEGRATYTPDIAIVNLGVQVDKSYSAQAALATLNAKMQKILPAIADAGIPKEDIQTQNYSLYTQYDYRDNISYVSGYNANQQISVKVRNFNSDNELVSKVIDAASKAGVNQVSGITFDLSNLNDVNQEARVKAIEDARSKAQGLAQAAGVRLGKIISWYDNIVQQPVPYTLADGKGGGGMVGAGGSQIPSGENEIIIQIGVNYRVK
ncbi:MAG: hypothetical protein A3B30_03865 [Candidatus Komeilibacteria bacterium RIFCSPLOWO2_01_FULL_52_15]|uniref:SIMPL domain-containing protein n=1 Tax=Candidatus Komeilibacteria bacterium RIFCSPLOWO2_01_FULL_52_15 TaxID=1798551 RepID=A0A1G2BQQ8_9BACT|nr:MAG: hypothetical protein A3B30_03865 [Candidatus Komeilibacteria bacterium RIFCSPLOWO2_01_FULL_52_15]